MILGICCWWQSNDRTKDPPHILHRKFSSKRVPRTGCFSPNIAHVHPPLCCRPTVPHKSPQKQQMQRNANKALPTNCSGPHRMLLPLPAGPSCSWSPCCIAGMQLGFSSNPPTPTPVHGEGIHYHAERRGCVARRTVAGLFSPLIHI